MWYKVHLLAHTFGPDCSPRLTARRERTGGRGPTDRQSRPNRHAHSLLFGSGPLKTPSSLSQALNTTKRHRKNSTISPGSHTSSTGWGKTFHGMVLPAITLYLDYYYQQQLLPKSALLHKQTKKFKSINKYIKNGFRSDDIKRGTLMWLRLILLLVLE